MKKASAYISIIFIFLLAVSASVCAQSDVVLTDSYTVTVPEGFVINPQPEASSDEFSYSHDADNADLDFVVMDSGDVETAEELKSIVMSDMSEFIPGYELLEERKYQSGIVTADIIRAKSAGDENDILITETAVCSAGQYFFIFNLVYSQKTENKYKSLMDDVLKTIRRK